MTDPTTHESREIEPGVFWTLLEPCTCQVLPHVLRPELASFVWLVGYRPHHIVEWAELPLPLTLERPAEPLRARDVRFDLQLPLLAFLDRLPVMHAGAGMTLLQMAHPIPDTLDYRRIRSTPGEYAALRQNGWLLTFALPHDREFAEVLSPDREHLVRVLSDPVIASFELP